MLPPARHHLSRDDLALSFLVNERKKIFARSDSTREMIRRPARKEWPQGTPHRAPRKFGKSPGIATAVQLPQVLVLKEDGNCATRVVRGLPRPNIRGRRRCVFALDRACSCRRRNLFTRQPSTRRKRNRAVGWLRCLEVGPSRPRIVARRAERCRRCAIFVRDGSSEVALSARVGVGRRRDFGLKKYFLVKSDLCQNRKAAQNFVVSQRAPCRCKRDQQDR